MIYYLDIDKDFDENRAPSFQSYVMNQSLNEDNTVTLDDSTSADNTIHCSLSENALNSSDYRLLRVLFKVDSNSDIIAFLRDFTTGYITNKTTLVVRIKYTYYDNAVLKVLTQEVPFNIKNINHILSGDDADYFEGIKILPFPNIAAQSIEVYIINKMGVDVRVKLLELKQSQDLHTGQTSTHINYAVGLRQVDAFTNGCLLYFYGENDPTRIEYKADNSNNFTGVLVDEELFIPFHRYNREL